MFLEHSAVSKTQDDNDECVSVCVCVCVARFTQGAGASREQRCSDRFGAQSIFAALLTLK